MDTPLLADEEDPPPPRRESRDVTFQLRTQASLRNSLAGEGIQARRPSYFQGLRAQSRAGSVFNLHLEDEELDVIDKSRSHEGTTPPVSPRASGSTAAEGSVRPAKFDPLAEVAKKAHPQVEVRLKNYSHAVPVRVDAPHVKTVCNQSPCYFGTTFVRNVGELITGKRQGSPGEILGHYEDKYVLRDVNLVLKPGTTYLVMGPPGSGKTSLLKAIAGLLRTPKTAPKLRGGRIEYNGVSVQDDPDMVLQNVVSYVGQLDNHAPFLTVQETFDFAADCRIGRAHQKQVKDPKNYSPAQPAPSLDLLSENLTVDGLDLAVCRDTYVGDANNRGVSGGQRRRVTVGEMLVGQSPVACADEISTGLDAAVTYDIACSIIKFAKAAKTTRLVSLLQPGPETFSLFDEVILLAEGQVIYAGPIDDVVDYFAALGYRQPNTMDVADFLQSVATPDGAMMFVPEESPMDEHYSAWAFAEAFRASERHGQIEAELASPPRRSWGGSDDDRTVVDEESNPGSGPGGDDNGAIPEDMKRSFLNPFWTSVGLLTRRFLVLLKRDKEFLIGKTIENIGMGVFMALIFLQAVAFPSSINGSDKIAEYFERGCPIQEVDEETAQAYNKLLAGTYSSIFLTVFHVLLGTLTSTPDEVDQRAIYYKHADAHFFQSAAFLIGRQISQLPLLAMEIIAFGLPFYLISGLALEARAFFVFLFILIAYKFALKMLYGVLAQTLPKKANVAGIGTFLYLLLTMTSGFIVHPAGISKGWMWLFWANPMMWAQQGMASNQFLSSVYDGYECTNFGYTWSLGQYALVDPRGWQGGDRTQWIGYTFAFLLPYTLLFAFITWLALKYVRIEPSRQHVKEGVNIGEQHETSEFTIPFTPVDLSFDKLTYEVTASTSKETLRLLNEVSGVFQAGRMCALMGSSGAGKTTLMDVIAMRKTSGTINGQIELNGFEQERVSFLRSSGYVEQFDVQQPELTVRETVEFSARLRLDANDPAIGSDERKMQFVDNVLETMELTDIQTLQVGSFEEGGLTFEQRKRLAIACELAGSPSVIFLDEPTSGLDSRGALVVIRAMRRIADSGRTVVATIHQPSAAVFEMFDDLILLKKGGNVVFFGELGDESCKLVQYFEERGAQPIAKQENPAAWVLRAYAGEHTSNDVDWAEVYKSSNEAAAMRDRIESIRAAADVKNQITFTSEFSTSIWDRLRFMTRRMLTIYKRSASYNMTRIAVAVLYAFLLGSMFFDAPDPNKEGSVWREEQAAGFLGTIFLSLNVIGTTAMTMAIPVAKRVRDVFYKHRASGMIGHNSVFVGMVVAEIPYLLLMSVLYVIVYCWTSSIFTTAGNFFYFVLFFFLHTASYSFFAQCFMCLVKDEKTVGALQGVWIGLNLFYGGFVVLPQNFFSFFVVGIWINATRYAYEGIIFTQFEDVSARVVASPLSPYFFYLQSLGMPGCSAEALLNDGEDSCYGTMLDYAVQYFGGKFSEANRGLDIGILVSWIVLALFGTWFCLKMFNYVNT